MAVFVAAVPAVVKVMGATAPAEGTVQRGVLSSIITVAVGNTAAFDVADVQDVYTRLNQEAAARVPVTAAARDRCRLWDSHGVDRELRVLSQRQPQTLAGLQVQGTVVITRGTDPIQAEEILTNVTFGGMVPDPTVVGAPQAADANQQTGYGIKATAAGRIEEWSLGTQTGFSNNGFMLIAEAAVGAVTLPVSDFAVKAGEAGVCGFAAARLVRVAIMAEGREVGDPLQTELERIRKAIGTKRIDVIAMLKEAAQRLRGVVL